MIRHHASFNMPSLTVKIEAVLKQIALEYPDQLIQNIPGVSHVPMDPRSRIRLPALIKTSFFDPQYGPTSAVGVLWYMDTPQPDRVKENQRGPGFERFFVHMDVEERDPEYPTTRPTDVD